MLMMNEVGQVRRVLEWDNKACADVKETRAGCARGRGLQDVDGRTLQNGSCYGPNSAALNQRSVLFSSGFSFWPVDQWRCAVEKI